MFIFDKQILDLEGGGGDFLKELCFINLFFQKGNPKIKFCIR